MTEEGLKTEGGAMVRVIKDQTGGSEKKEDPEKIGERRCWISERVPKHRA